MHTIMLIIHVILGTVALLSGAVAIVAKKGRRLHKRAGSVYYYSMYGVGILAFAMTIMKFNPFLMSIAVFSVYMNYSGKRSIDNWRLAAAYTPTLKDRLPFYLAAMTGLFMIGLPVTQMIEAGHLFVPILGIFGILMVYAAIRDIQKYSKAEHFQPRNKMWLLHHISMMGGAYIATFTAFLVNNVNTNPAWIAWLSPTIAGATLIIISSIKWAKKLNKGTGVSQGSKTGILHQASRKTEAGKTVNS